ncbi:hypothetical protein FJ366_01795 [Candidatus Dependentiae bacterium]|nr:hypothetical protein [Candidatus Dependentiae bacterium]
MKNRILFAVVLLGLGLFPCFMGAIVSTYTEKKNLWGQSIITFYSPDCADFEWDGNGQEFDFSHLSVMVGTGLWIEGKGTNSGHYATPSLLIKNITLKNFNSWKIKSGTGRINLEFGDNVTFFLGSDEKLTMDWSFVGVKKHAVIHGCGYAMKLLFDSNKEKVIRIANGAEVEFKEFSNFFIKNTRAGRLPISLGDDSVVTFNNLKLSLEGNCYVTAGAVAIVGDVLVQGEERSFVFCDKAQLIVMPNSSVMFDKNLFLEYRSSQKNNFVLFDNTSRMFFNDSSLYAWKNGPCFDSGIIVPTGNVTFSSDSVCEEQGIQYAGVRFEVPAGSVLDLYGCHSYSDNESNNEDSAADEAVV